MSKPTEDEIKNDGDYFEQINNSRNDLMRQLAEAEKKIEDGNQI